MNNTWRPTMKHRRLHKSLEILFRLVERRMAKTEKRLKKAIRTSAALEAEVSRLQLQGRELRFQCEEVRNERDREAAEYKRLRGQMHAWFNDIAGIAGVSVFDEVGPDVPAFFDRAKNASAKIVEALRSRQNGSQP